MAVPSRLRLTSLHLLGLWVLAGVQPLFDQLSRNPEFFVAHHASGVEILALAAVLIFLVPVVLIGFVLLANVFGERARAVTVGVAVTAVSSVLVIQALKWLGVETSLIAAPVSIAVAAGLAFAYLHVAVVRTFASVLAVIAVVAVPSRFLFSSDVRGLWWASVEPAVAAEHERSAVRPTPVVMVIFDEMPLVSVLDRHRQIDPKLYPNLAALGQEGTWFRNATTVDDFTRWAMPAILTGNYPTPNAVPTRSHYPNTLFTLFDRTHRLEVFEAMTALAPQPSNGNAGSEASLRIAAMADDVATLFLHVVAPADVATTLPDLTAGWANFRAQPAVADDNASDTVPAWRTRWRQGHYMDAVGLATSFIDGIGTDDPQPTFYFLHTLVSHHPYNRLPTGQQNKTQTSVPGHWHGKVDVWAVAQHYQRHLLQIGFVDTLVGRIRQRLRSSGLYDRSLIVITADHGVSFLPGGPPRNFRPHNAAEIMRVPLVFKWPKGIGENLPHVSDVNAETIDIAPTVADVLGIRLPWPSDGASLLNPTHSRSTKRMFQDRGARAWTFAPSEPDVTPALNRKLELFGESANYYRAPSPGAFVDLIGRPVSSLRVTDSATRVDLDFAWEYENMDLRAPAVPFDVSGRFVDLRPDTFVGVVVNGVLQAVTRTWNTNPRAWLATPPLDAWRNGPNAIDVFVIERDTGGPVLRRARLDVVRPDDLNLVSDVARVNWGVRQWGFYNEERRPDGQMFRWARPASQLNITTRSRKEPRALQVSVISLGRVPTKPLKIEVNGCTLFEGRISRGWSATLPLEPCLTTDSIVIRFTTELSRSKRDKRKFGVAFSSVKLQ